MTGLGGILPIGVDLAVPLLLAALGEMMAERAGVINVGVEGMMLAGALAAVVGASHGPWAGALAAMAAGALLAALFALVAVRIGADQVVVGTALNILAIGLTGVFFRAISSAGGVSPQPFTHWAVPGLAGLPVVGAAFFAQTPLAYLAWGLAPLTGLFLFRTRAGLRLRAVGEYPAAADGAGASVGKVRTLASLWGGALAGLAGAFLSISYTTGYTQGMSAGKGFIALAIVILGRWNPGGVALASLLFGIVTALGLHLQAVGNKAVPYQVLQALPYLLTLAALLLRARLRAAGPAALGTAYSR